MQLLMESPLFLFFILFLATHLIYLRFFSSISLTISSGSIIMAIAMFSIACLSQLGFPFAGMMAVSIEVMIIWLYISVILMQEYIGGVRLFAHGYDRAAIGYWVSSSALVAMLLDSVEQTLHGFIILFCIVAAGLYFYYLILMARWLGFCLVKRFHIHVSGLIFLPSISTQAIALILLELFSEDMPAEVSIFAILLGVFFYLIGLASILWHLLRAHSHHIAVGWSNVNVMNYAAVCITGFVMLKSQIFGTASLKIIWWWAVITFVISELLELIRLVLRIRMKGVRWGALVYDNTQWARIFAFSVLYLFAWSYHAIYVDAGISASVIANIGQYVTALLLGVQLCLALNYVLKREAGRS